VDRTHQEAVQAIEARELLMRRVLSPTFRQDMVDEMIKTLRAASLRVVETIAAWNRVQSVTRPFL
jgi:L-serine deaminase